MNQYVTGAVIKELREKSKLTQLQLAEKLGVSDKTISKWETAKGYPDITLLEPIADAFSVSVTELISGNTVTNSNVSANMMRSRFFICPVCGNIIHGIEHEMNKRHYISFIAAVSSDRIQMVKLYPEGNAEARFKIRGVKKIYFYCNRSGLFYLEPLKGIDDRTGSYEDTEERRQLEAMAKKLFG